MNKYLAIAFEERLRDLGIKNMEKFAVPECFDGKISYDFKEKQLFCKEGRVVGLNNSYYYLLLESEIYKLPFPDRIKVGDKYYFVTLFNEIEETTYKATPCDGNLIETNNCFETREEAKKHKLVAVKKEDDNDE